MRDKQTPKDVCGEATIRGERVIINKIMANGVKRAIWYRPYLSLEAILTGRQLHEKLQCLYGNLMLNHFSEDGCSEKKTGNCNLKLHSKGL